MFGGGDFWSSTRYLLVKNESGSEAPPFAALLVTGEDAETGILLVTRPDRDDLDPTRVLLGGPGKIAAGKEGQATYDDPWHAAYDPCGGLSSGSASGSGTGSCSGSAGGSGAGGAGVECGTVAGSWKLSPGRKGFRVWAVSGDSARALVVRGARQMVGVVCNDDGTVSGDFLE